MNPKVCVIVHYSDGDLGCVIGYLNIFNIDKEGDVFCSVTDGTSVLWSRANNEIEQLWLGSNLSLWLDKTRGDILFEIEEDIIGLSLVDTCYKYAYDDLIKAGLIESKN